MRTLEGKRLLVLGANSGADDIVRYARDNGAWVSVVDWQPVAECAVKQIADEAINLSTAEVGKLCAYVEQRGIDGVIAGVSEFNLLRAMEVSEVCGLPFYCTREQWDTVESKDRFRELCERHGVPCPKTYYRGEPKGALDAKISYPAVLKPVDASASAGVHICKSRDELVNFLDDSAAESGSGRVIVEEFVTGGEFTAHYTIHKGVARLACLDDRYPAALHGGAVTTIPIARVYPGRCLEAYLEAVDPSMQELCEGLGIDEGIMFVQGIHDEDTGRFAVFEAGLRSAGEVPNRFLRDVNGLDYLALLVGKALSAEIGYDIGREDPSLGGMSCATVSFACAGGTIGSITGAELAMSNLPSIVSYEKRYGQGAVLPDGDTLRQIVVRFVLECNSRRQLVHDVAILNELADVCDEDGRSIAVKPNPEAFLR